MASQGSSSGSRLADFEVLGRLGSGSFGVCYKATRKADGLTYVLKTINIQDLALEQQQEAIKEVTILAAMDSPCVVGYYDSFVESDVLYIVMEYCNRGDLQGLLKKAKAKGQPLSERRVWKLFLQILIGVRYLHSQRVLHRDLKCANVFLCTGEVVKLGDLGVAKVLEHSTAFASTLVGTPYYLSPELCEDKPYNAKSDMWALGCILYECCTYEHPFNARNQGALILKIIQGKFEPVSADAYSSLLRNVVNKLLTRAASRRPTADQLLRLPQILAKAQEVGVALPDDVLIDMMAAQAQAPTPSPSRTMTLGRSGSHSRLPSRTQQQRGSTGNGNIRGTRVRGPAGARQQRSVSGAVPIRNKRPPPTAQAKTPSAPSATPPAWAQDPNETSLSSHKLGPPASTASTSTSTSTSTSKRPSIRDLKAVTASMEAQAQEEEEEEEEEEQEEDFDPNDPALHAERPTEYKALPDDEDEAESFNVTEDVEYDPDATEVVWRGDDQWEVHDEEVEGGAGAFGGTMVDNFSAEADEEELSEHDDEGETSQVEELRALVAAGRDQCLAIDGVTPDIFDHMVDYFESLTTEGGEVEHSSIQDVVTSILGGAGARVGLLDRGRLCYNMQKLTALNAALRDALSTDPQDPDETIAVSPLRNPRLLRHGSDGIDCSEYPSDFED